MRRRISERCDSKTGMPRSPIRWRRAGALLVIAGYVAATGYFLARYALGDFVPHPIAYFFTWDMFPYHLSVSSRRVAVGRTASGKYVQLHPAPQHQYRGGVRGDLTHVELERAGGFYAAAVAEILPFAAAQNPDDPIVHIDLFERYWPAKYNYPDDLYEAWAGETHPHRYGWRLRAEFEVPGAGGRSP
jgi:hypothetical protein